jgi:1-acyl-sn-glycerol-3-phosphate acyltransferase
MPSIDGSACRPSRLSRGCRALRTGVAFTAFGVGALAVAGIGFPFLRLLGGTRDIRERRAQRLVHYAFRVFVRLMIALGLIRVTAFGLERMRRPGILVIANHPSLIDVVLLIAAMPQADCVVKRAAWSNRFIRGIVTGAGYVANTEGAELIETCVARLRAGRSLLLFPEGTRSPRGGLGPFRRGAARIALAAGCEVVPVVITCDPPTLMKHQPWYVVPDRAAHLSLTASDGTPFGGSTRAGNVLRAAREWTDEVHRYYAQQLECMPHG